MKVDTFAGFYWWLVSSYGRYAKDGTSKKPWLIGSKEIENIIIPNGYEGFVFDKLELRAYETIRLTAVSNLISKLYPLIIIDEFQDVHDRLFNIIIELAKLPRLVLLRGPGQCIYRELKSFDPDEILKRCENELKPEKYKLESAGDDKQRYCPVIGKLVNSYKNAKPLNLANDFPVKLRLVPKKNRNGINNRLDIFAAMETRDIYKFLKKSNYKPIIAVLANTNLAVAEIHGRIITGSDAYNLHKREASLYFKEELFLQYGRLILSLLPLFWIAKKRQNTVNIDEVLQSLILLFQEKDQKDNYIPKTWKPLAEILAKKSKRFKKSTKIPTWQRQLKSNIDIINNWLRKTKTKLKKEIRLDASTPFDGNDKLRC